MEKLYIKFKGGDQNSLDLAIKEAKRLGYTRMKYEDDEADDSISMVGITMEDGYSLLGLDWAGEYWTSAWEGGEKYLISDGYKEHIIDNQYRYGEIIEALGEDNIWRKAKYLCAIPSINCMYRFGVVDFDVNIDEPFIPLFCDEIRKLPKTIKITTDDGQTLEISKENAINLGFKVN